MRFSVFMAVVCAVLASAQTVPDPELRKAAEEVEKTRGLVEQGDVARADLERAEA